MTDIDPKSHEADGVLQRATTALREQARSGEPPAFIVEKTLAALRSPRPEARPILGRILTTKTLKRSAWAASLVAVVIVVVAIVMQFSSTTVLAQALDKVREAKSVRYKLAGTMPDPKDAKNPTTIQSTVTVVAPSWWCVETPESTVIFDFNAGKSLTLDPKSKSAVRMTLSNQPKDPRQRDLLADLRAIDLKEAVDLGEEEINGRKTEKYRIKKKEEDGAKPDMKVWIDAQTRLPVRMEVQLGGHPGIQSVATDFQWDVKVDKALLALEIPEGYQVQVMTVAVNVSPTTERDLLTALKTASELNGGSFPDEFNNMAFFKLLDARYPDESKLDAQTKDRMQQQANLLIRGLLFVQLPTHGADWHYAGKGVVLGDTVRPVLWYRPTGKEIYRLIDGSLTVKEIKPAELPKVESVDIGLATLMSEPTTKPAGIPLIPPVVPPPAQPGASPTTPATQTH